MHRRKDYILVVHLILSYGPNGKCEMYHVFDWVSSPSMDFVATHDFTGSTT
jgi:hypothetical protein